MADTERIEFCLVHRREVRAGSCDFEDRGAACEVVQMEPLSVARPEFTSHLRLGSPLPWFDPVPNWADGYELHRVLVAPSAYGQPVREFRFQEP